MSPRDGRSLRLTSPRRPRDSPGTARFGAVALAAFVASRTGRPQDYFLPSLLANAGAAVAWAVSIWIRRPFLGLMGWPMVLVVIWLSWLVVEPTHRARRQALAEKASATDPATA